MALSDQKHSGQHGAQHGASRYNEAAASGFSLSRLAGALLILIPVVAAIYFLFIWEPEQDNTVQSQPIVEETPQPEVEEPEVASTPPPQTETAMTEEPVAEPEPLPALNESDDELAQGLQELNPDPSFQAWYPEEELARKFVIVIDNLAVQEIARKYINIPKPKTPFKVKQAGNKIYLDPVSYARYDSYIETITQMNNADLIAYYERYAPLFNEAFDELGYEDKDFKTTLLQAIDKVLATPIIENEIELVRPSVYYKFANPELEGLSDLQKQIIRLGPDNTSALFTKLRALKEELQP